MQNLKKINNKERITVKGMHSFYVQPQTESSEALLTDMITQCSQSIWCQLVIRQSYTQEIVLTVWMLFTIIKVTKARGHKSSHPLLHTFNP